MKNDKECKKMMDLIDEINPYATYLSESTLSTVDSYIDTGSLALNAIISGSLYGGIPEGRVVQFAGPSMTGKTFFIQKIIANAQKMGKYVVVFDSENAIEPDAAVKHFGIDPTKVKYVTALSIENTRNSINKFLKAVAETKRLGEFLIVIDNIASMESELGETRMSKDSTSADMGNFAKSVKSLLKTCTKWGSLTKTTIVFTNEVYEDPTCLYPSLDKDFPGGHAARYKPSVTIQLARKPVKDDEGKTIDNTLATAQKNYSGIILRCLSVKNRFIKQYLEVELYLSFSTGLDKYYGLLELMRGMGVVSINGKTYTDWEGNPLGYYKNWRKDKDLWENKLLPKLESRLLEEWSYGNGDDVPDEEEQQADDSSEEEEIDESPLAKLKNMKKKVSSKIDELEAEEEEDE